MDTYQSKQPPRTWLRGCPSDAQKAYRSFIQVEADDTAANVALPGSSAPEPHILYQKKLAREKERSRVGCGLFKLKGSSFVHYFCCYVLVLPRPATACTGHAVTDVRSSYMTYLYQSELLESGPLFFQRFPHTIRYPLFTDIKMPTLLDNTLKSKVRCFCPCGQQVWREPHANVPAQNMVLGTLRTAPPVARVFTKPDKHTLGSLWRCSGCCHGVDARR
ncbi:hypothetical protein IF1G_10379 [Cordyceps javanica]|uniref:Uncharacterized protein n=1 Tax=Cordyceps javanica TaxID=43265 RepID=A0A545UN19_9HYPO|nr:hypothetical protein IF1G_10379 [Cordyceps javanica]